MLVLLIAFFLLHSETISPTLLLLSPSFALNFLSLCLSLCLLLGAGWLINAQIGSRHGYGFKEIVYVCVCLVRCLCALVCLFESTRGGDSLNWLCSNQGPWLSGHYGHKHYTFNKLLPLLDRSTVWSVVENRKAVMEWGRKTFTEAEIEKEKKEGNFVVFYATTVVF